MAYEIQLFYGLVSVSFWKAGYEYGWKTVGIGIWNDKQIYHFVTSNAVKTYLRLKIYLGLSEFFRIQIS